MNRILQLFSEHFNGGILPLDPRFPIESYVPLDLSASNPDLHGLDISDPGICQRYIDRVLVESAGLVAYGGYLEQRNLYDSPRFVQRAPYMRDIHLAVDFWAPTGTAVCAPIAGTLHSFGNNSDPGNYGPTIILEHHAGDIRFYALYGHLSMDSLDGLIPGRAYQPGVTLATLGSPEVNGGYAPHLHFQIILDLQGFSGDYPGVCAEHEVESFKNNCPDPNWLLKL